MATANAKTTDTGRKLSRIPTKAEIAAATPETEAQLRRIATMLRIYERRGKAASAAVEACNHSVTGTTAVIFIMTKQAQAACDRADAAAKALKQLYRDTVVTPDLPERVLMEVLRVRINDCQSEEVWCQRIRELGGPRIDPMWLWKYRMAHMLGRGTRIDSRVRKAMILDQAPAKAAAKRLRA